MVGLAIWIVAACIVIPVVIWVAAIVLGIAGYTIYAPIWLLNSLLKSLGISSQKIAKSLRMKDFYGDFSDKKITAEWLKEKVQLYNKFVQINANNEARINEVAGQFDDLLGLSQNLCELASEIGGRLNESKRLFLPKNKQELEESKNYFRKKNYPIPTWRFKTMPISSIRKADMWSPDFLSLKVGDLIFNANAQWVSELSTDGTWSISVYSGKDTIFHSTTQKHFWQGGEPRLNVYQTAKNIKRTSLQLFKPGMWILDVHNLLVDFKEELITILKKEETEVKERQIHNNLNKFTAV